MKELVQGLRHSMPRLGTRKLYHLLEADFRSEGLKVGRDKLFTILRHNGLLAARRRKCTLTTNSKHWLRKYDNLVKDVVLERPEQVFVSDITYIPTEQGYSYLSLITDACSKKIMGYALSEDLSTKGCLEALEMALKNRSTEAPLIHHSDRGYQYCSKEYVGLLSDHHIRISMTTNGDPYQNAIAERVNGILKEEFYLSETLPNHSIAAKHVAQSIETYNTQRPHLSCGMMTPEATHKRTSFTPRSWKHKRGPHQTRVNPSTPI